MQIVFDSTGNIVDPTDTLKNFGFTKNSQIGEQARIAALGNGAFMTLTHGSDSGFTRQVVITDNNGVVQDIAVSGAFKVEYLTSTTTKITNNTGSVFAGRVSVLVTN